jgi:hypothetical protein
MGPGEGIHVPDQLSSVVDNDFPVFEITNPPDLPEGVYPPRACVEMRRDLRESLFPFAQNADVEFFSEPVGDACDVIASEDGKAAQLVPASAGEIPGIPKRLGNAADSQDIRPECPGSGEIIDDADLVFSDDPVLDQIGREITDAQRTQSQRL